LYMATNLESDISADFRTAKENPVGWLKFALLTAGSALIGGVAAAWWYRKTLAKLRETREISNNPHFGMPIDQGRDADDEM